MKADQRIRRGSLAGGIEVSEEFHQRRIRDLAEQQWRCDIARDIAAANDPVSFIVEKEKQLVLQDRSAKVSAELIVPQLWFGEPGSVGEECICVQLVVPEKFEQRSVELVRPRLGGHVDSSAGASTILCREGTAGGLEFLNCLHPDGIDD